MKSIFNLITSIALRFRWLTLVLVVLFMVLGAVAISELNQELLPPIEFPQTLILAQASGMTSEQVLTVLTERLEPEIDAIDQIINLESQTTGAFGAIITAYNDFGQDQVALQDEIRAAIDRVWLPTRRITAPEGEDAQAFASGLLADLTPEILIYFAESNSNFLFQLTPDVWNIFSDEVLRSVVAYLAAQEDASSAGTVLERLVEKEIVPQLRTVADVASVSIDGGQSLPGEGDSSVSAEAAADEDAGSLLLRLSPEVWAVISERIGAPEELNEATVEAVSGVEFVIPETAPALPESWQFDFFTDASDLLEVQTLTTPIADVLNDFYANGVIAGALGQTNDLTADTVRQMLEIEPSMVEYFEAEHLVAMSPEAFAELPQDFIDGLDGFTRDALAAASLAQSITGEAAVREPVDLPDAWRIQPPGLVSFSFADLPLATFSVSSTGVPVGAEQAADAADSEETGETVDESGEAPVQDQEIPEGPALPPLFAGVGADSADDLINLELPAPLAEAFGAETVPAAQLLNLMATPPDLTQGTGGEGGGQGPALSLDLIGFAALLNAGRNIIGQFTPDVVQFLVENDPTFIPQLDASVYDYFSDEVLALEGVSPPLAEAWDVLSSQPQFINNPLNTADDVLVIGEGRASTVLNTINAEVPAGFEGYEVRLFDSLTPGVVRYFVVEEPDFYSNLDRDVLLKFHFDVLAALPEEFVASLDEETAAQVQAIASGEQNSAFAALQELYATNIAPADPDAPVLNAAWSQIAGFYGIEMDTADDFFRFPDDFAYEDAAAFINSIFAGPQGANFARNNNLITDTPVEAWQYILNRDATVLSNLGVDALRLMTEDQLAVLPEGLQQRASEGSEVFTPLTQVTRTNRQSSLLVTVFKDKEANTVSAYAEVEELLLAADEANDEIVVGVVFEQSSFIEESITGVAREGGLGAVFAIIIILIFMSSGVWRLQGRRLVGGLMIVIFAILLVLLVASGLEVAGNDWGEAFAQSDVVFRVLLLVGIVSGLFVLLWPGEVPYPAWRATIVIAVSIPLSILTSFVAMRYFSPFMYDLIFPLTQGEGFGADLAGFILNLFPQELTLNIMTLSGLTVAIGRVVDDSIVVLENIFRQIQAGGDKREAVLSGTRDVSAAIFVATLIAMVVFLPLGLTGGIIGAFFLPFGLAVTYALAGSFLVAITVVPVLTYMLVDADDMPEDDDIWIANYYLPVLRAALSSNLSKAVVVILAFISLGFSGFLFSQRPAAFLPSFGEPQISVNVEMPPETKIVELNEKVLELESFIYAEVPEEQIGAVQTTVGGGSAGFETLLTGNNVEENRASITIGLEVSESELDVWTQTIREESVRIFGQENVIVSAASLSEGGFGGFALVVSGPAETLEELDPTIIAALEEVEGITNVSSNLSAAAEGTGDGPVTYIRVNQQSALSYSAELETEDSIGVTQDAITKITELENLPDTVTVSQGFESETQTQGFQSVFVAITIASVIIVVILFVTFSSPVYWLAIFVSVLVAPVGAAVALALADRVLGISALIGLLMLLGLVITNAVVLIDRVRSNLTERNMTLKDSLIEAGGRRLRPILMTSLTTIIALIPLAVGLSEGAIIAAELGSVVIGGMVSSTLLTLIVVPVMYSILTPVHRFLFGLVGMKTRF